jgi:hypothetical protein
VELMAQLTETFLPCIFEHGAGLFLPRAFRYLFDPLLGPSYSAQLAAVRAALDPVLLRPGKAFVQPGKEATMTLYPLTASLDELYERASEVVAEQAPEWTVARNVLGVEVRPPGIDKALGMRRAADLVGLRLDQFAGVGDSDPDISFLKQCAFSAAPANATRAVQSTVDYVANAPYGEGLLEIIGAVTQRGR